MLNVVVNMEAFMTSFFKDYNGIKQINNGLIGSNLFIIIIIF